MPRIDRSDAVDSDFHGVMGVLAEAVSLTQCPFITWIPLLSVASVEEKRGNLVHYAISHAKTKAIGQKGEEKIACISNISIFVWLRILNPYTYTS